MRIRRAVILAAALAAALLIPASAATAGPIIIAGIDVEDGGPGGHGPISNWTQVASTNNSRVTNNGNGLLVIGGGKDAADDVTEFWNAIGQGISQPVTYVNGAAIGTASFAGFRQIAIVSSSSETSSGGLTQAESNALATRRTGIASFVNGGGGLLAFSQSGLSNPYSYLASVGSFAFNVNLFYDNINPTADGQAVGITDALDVVAWHDEYTKFPPFLRVLATNAETGRAAALGGPSVAIDGTVPSTASTILPRCSATGRVTITVRDNVGGSGPRAVLYRINNGVRRFRSTANVGLTGRATLVLPSGPRVRVEFWGLDRAGNQETVHRIRFLRVDRANRCRAAAPRPRFTG